MRVVIQRVKHAQVEVAEQLIGKIGLGLMILIGFEAEETEEEFEWLSQKIVNLRIFPDENGVMNRSILDCDGEILLVSQFTLHAATKKGNRPSYIRAAKPDLAIPYYEKMISVLGQKLGKPVQTGEFGADMQVSLLNDGPVTIIIDTKQKDF
ncbi:D-aminoacyl-tRNA deacylase [Ornithobacterium rhinotracheale]|uniref:D-aminoacyl-tRNA deacylase n=1 Tax=Ornithobacterium rhinotracheale (strain ATCC 51463 / DSM 15997 / CCUG 23171 / CIP 104009 / LMG 9086) TaxID=867902 RepID=I4A023_ORNRL|nr:D-aminoacyl-tRNA deacylase [Ornithobacterium rhinotracheale]AFL97307.1 D-tyrosyl-tRNA(Tyr) deacylase [Ornithobacterium rhinotracheale DSM 15997]AIP99359.1 D-tyrosyl-tRNA(Tyr) deacylase [Ornithobacterium rhinotracheale ORT-UMN 88]KGB67160.1 D-tyrosyl-tRNA(Tyr) deacylase [Ornithobacterium rhinotracheale H06-030791]MBN3663038.1 D-tyrosyl-tRNA(Tyr) deacylase [Ornithobacterium rhinotracheale]MCK0194198.1 D-aminoacyl-tRNA deacylase [Ornithobacterium rhinotracheale]